MNYNSHKNRITEVEDKSAVAKDRGEEGGDEGVGYKGFPQRGFV